jgi:hypothetical protein
MCRTNWSADDYSAPGVVSARSGPRPASARRQIDVLPFPSSPHCATTTRLGIFSFYSLFSFTNPESTRSRNLAQELGMMTPDEVRSFRAPGSSRPSVASSNRLPSSFSRRLGAEGNRTF